MTMAAKRTSPAEKAAPRRKSNVVNLRVSRLENAYARCRSIGHAWDPIPVTRPAFFGVTIDLRCEHCTTTRRDIRQPLTGKLLARNYQYPEGYKYEGTTTRAQWFASWADTLPETMARIGVEGEDD